MKRCDWVRPDNELYCRYHDEECGVPVHDDRRLCEMQVLEGAQAGLSWEPVLKKREAYRAAFDGFEPAIVACYDDRKVEELLANPGIIRNRAKILSAIRNAKVFLKIQREFDSFDRYFWAFTDGKPIQNCYTTLQDIPAGTPLSDRIAKDLKKRGMNFVGTTILYAYMQSVGMVNDHQPHCFRYEEITRLT